MRPSLRWWSPLIVAVLACTKDEPTNPVIPTNPSIQTPSSGALISTIHAPVRGRAPDADSVLIRVDSVWPSVRIPCAEDGSFSLERCRIGGHGGRVIWAQDAGDSTSVSEPVPVYVDTRSSAVPVILFPPSDVTLPVDPIPIIGIAPPEVAQVEIHRDGALLGTTPNHGGLFRYETFAATGQGSAQFYPRGILASGMVTAFGESISVTVGGGSSLLVQEIASPVNGSVIPNAEVVLQGISSGPGDLHLFLNGGATGIIARVETGPFVVPSLTLPVEGPFVLGLASFRGGTWVAEGGVALSVDLTQPAAPVLLQPSEGALYRTRDVQISGAAEPLAMCVISLDSLPVDSLTVTTTGAFQCALTVPRDGDYRVAASARDRAGNQSETSSWVSFFVDASAPQSPQMVTPAPNTLIVGESFMVAGSTTPGAYVEVLLDSGVRSRVRAGDDGGFSFSIDTPRPDGSHRVGVRASHDPSLGWVFGDSVIVHVDLTEPPPPFIHQPGEGAFVRGTELLVIGSSEAHAAVAVTYADSLLAGADAGIDGMWQVAIPLPFETGVLSLSAVQTDTAGHGSAAGPMRTVTVDNASPALVISSPPADSVFAANPAAIAGVAEPGAAVTIDGVHVVPAPGGSFSDMVFLAEGDDTISIEAHDAAGNRAAVRLPLRLDTTPPVITLSSPAESTITTQTSVSVTGTTEPGCILTLQDAQVPLAGDGSFSASASLQHGWNALHLHTVDAIGWEYELTCHVASDRIPDAPTVLSPSDGSLVLIGRPTLTLHAAQDDDGDALSYAMTVSDDAAFTTPVAAVEGLDAVGQTVEWTVTPELECQGTRFWWRARAWDGVTHGPWSDAAAFRVPDVGARDPHRLFGFGDSITPGAQGIPVAGDSTIWIWMSPGYPQELESALTVFLGSPVTVEVDYVPGGSSEMGLEEMPAPLDGTAGGYLLLLFGTIDANAQVDPDETVGNLAAIVQQAHERDMVAIVGTVPPRIPPEECGYGWADPTANTRVIALNQAIAAWAQEDSIPLADHYTALYEAAMAMGPPPWPHEMDNPLFNVLSLDGIHPNGTGYSLMAREWYETITGRDDFPTLPATVAEPSLRTPPPGARRLSPREVLGAP